MTTTTSAPAVEFQGSGPDPYSYTSPFPPGQEELGARPSVFEITRQRDDQAAVEIARLLGFFSFGHLPPFLRAVSRPFSDLAHAIARSPGEPGQVVLAITDLLRAKDAAVRAVLVVDAAARKAPRLQLVAAPSELELRGLGAMVTAVLDEHPEGVIHRWDDATHAAVDAAGRWILGVRPAVQADAT